jgi:hypothetical protein
LLRRNPFICRRRIALFKNYNWYQAVKALKKIRMHYIFSQAFLQLMMKILQSKKRIKNLKQRSLKKQKISQAESNGQREGNNNWEDDQAH